jgi:ubiquinone/menaquinone biosynthesis C-methylase UbiE
MSSPNAAFSNSIARNYEDYLVPLIFEHYAKDLANRMALPAEARVLETAAGTGALTRHLCDILPIDGRIMATDLNASMLDLTADRLNGHPGLSCQVADATDLPFEDRSFDVVGCQFGVMFFPDRQRGFTEAARVLKPGGQFVFNLWDSLAHNRFASVVHETVTELYPYEPPTFMAIPFARQDLSAIKDELEEAGFSHIEISVLPEMSRAPSASHVVKGLVAGSPLRLALEELGGLDEAKLAVEAAIVDEFGAGAVEAPMQATRISARRR